MQRAQRQKVAFGDIMAFSGPAAANDHTVFSIQKSPEDKGQIDPSRAHDTNNLDIRGILLSGNSSQVRGGVSSPIAQKTQESGLELDSCSHSCLLPRQLSLRCSLIGCSTWSPVDAAPGPLRGNSVKAALMVPVHILPPAGGMSGGGKYRAYK
jgi:hypothetical protein